GCNEWPSKLCKKIAGPFCIARCSKCGWPHSIDTGIKIWAYRYRQSAVEFRG
ncbi:unnamed protein product, partial [Heterosigma akashiwo]